METSRPPANFPATQLEDAYRAFDRRNQGRLAAGQLRQLYQERSGHHSLVALLEELRLTQGDAGWHLHRLYMGPAGCGKSTDLAWLVAELEKDTRLREELLIVHYGIGQAGGMGRSRRDSRNPTGRAPRRAGEVEPVDRSLWPGGCAGLWYVRHSAANGP